MVLLPLTLAWPLLVISCMCVPVAHTTTWRTIPVLPDKPSLNVEDLLNHSNTCLPLEEPPIYIVYFKLFYLSVGKSHICKEFSLVLEVLRVDEAHLSDGVLLSYDHNLIINALGNPFSDFISANKREAFSLHLVFHFEASMVCWLLRFFSFCNEAIRYFR